MTRKRKRSDRKPTKPTAIGQVLFDYVLEDRGGYITQEFQDYGYRLAVDLDDLKSKSLYIKLAKNTDRSMLEKALAFVNEANNVKHRGRLFMWALKKLKNGEKIYTEFKQNK